MGLEEERAGGQKCGRGGRKKRANLELIVKTSRYEVEMYE